MLRIATALAFSALFTVLLLEGALRLTGLAPVQGLHSVSAEDYERIPGWWEPGQDFVDRVKPALPHRIHINALGLRGPEVASPPRGPRVLCIGDSFTFGDFVSDDETLPAQLSRLLGPEVEVLNGGVGGTTIVDQRVFLERALPLHPDVVVLVYSENDLWDLRADLPLHVQFARNRELKSGPLSAVYRALRDTATFNAALLVRGWLRGRRASAPAPGGAARAREFAALADRYGDEVVALRETLAVRGVPLVVAAFPSHERVAGTTEEDTLRPVREALAERGIELVDLTAALIASGRPVDELYLLPHDGHASPAGNRAAAEALAPSVRRALAASAPAAP